MTREEAIAKIMTVTQLSQADIEGFLQCSPGEQEALVRAYRTAGVMPTHSAWAEVLEILQACAELASLVTPIGGAVATVFQIATLV